FCSPFPPLALTLSSFAIHLFLLLAGSTRFGLYWRPHLTFGPDLRRVGVWRRTTLEEGLAAAAFYDLEGTLVSTNLVHTLGFYSRNQQGLWRSLTKSAATLVSLPLFAAADQYSRNVFNELFFKRYKGETEDRMRFFADELFE